MSEYTVKGGVVELFSGDKSVRIAVGEKAVVTNPVSVSDGYHTFEELYEHRIELFLALCRAVYCTWDGDGTDGECPVWRSNTHSDGTSMKGWFIMGLYSAKGMQITYHLPDKYWDRTELATTLDKAPEWDGHTSADVLKRLAEL